MSQRNIERRGFSEKRDVMMLEIYKVNHWIISFSQRHPEISFAAFSIGRVDCWGNLNKSQSHSFSSFFFFISPHRFLQSLLALPKQRQKLYILIPFIKQNKLPADKVGWVERRESERKESFCVLIK